jgi:hypothetical protein
VQPDEPVSDEVLPWSGPADNDEAVPDDKTGAEEYFYRKHMQRRTPVVVVMTNGNRHHGWIEWYDRDVVKLHSLRDPNLFLRKDEVRYLYKLADDPDDATEVPTPPPLRRSRRGRRRGGRSRTSDGRT